MFQNYLSNVRFVKSITKVNDKPVPILPEIAIVGRSNVGKSSLINSLFNQKKLAKISSTPGKTQVINYFKIEGLFYFVDLPGYGYAKVPKQELNKWKSMIEGYLINNDELILVLLLIDSRRGILPIDQVMIEWMEHLKIKFQIILTKIDKISKNNVTTIKNKVENQSSQGVISYSSKTNFGRDDLINLLNSEINK